MWLNSSSTDSSVSETPTDESTDDDIWDQFLESPGNLTGLKYIFNQKSQEK